jgi:hypothetical protein
MYDTFLALVTDKLEREVLTDELFRGNKSTGS